MLAPIAEWLRGYWTVVHQIPRWRGETTNDIFRQENRLHKIIIGYAGCATTAITTHEYWVTGGLNHGREELYEEVMTYVSPLMLEDVAVLLGDFVALYEERNVTWARIQGLECRAALLQGEVMVEDSLHHVESAETTR